MPTLVYIIKMGLNAYVAELVAFIQERTTYMILAAHMNNARQSQIKSTEKMYNFQKKINDLQEKIEHYIVNDDSLNPYIHELYDDFYDMVEDHEIAQQSNVIIQYLISGLYRGKLDQPLMDSCLEVLENVQYQVQFGELLLEIYKVLIWNIILVASRGL